VVLGLWFVISYYHGNGQFGCQVDLSAAHADDNSCPATLGQAANDAQWAAARIATIVREHVTTGLLYDEDGHEEKIVSGRNGSAYQSVLRYLAPYPDTVVRDRPKGVDAAGHVEPKATAIMRESELTFGVLVINNPTGPCSYASGQGCGVIMQLILPVRSTIVVWWPGGGHGTFQGRAVG
jgi:hypothetical protein